MLKLLVFDLDGTLADTRRDLAESVNHALAQSGRPALPLEKVMGNVGNGAERLIASCLAQAVHTGAENSGDPLEAKRVLAIFLEHYRTHCMIHTRAYPGTEAALKKLRHDAAGAERRFAVLTNKPQEPTQKILEGLGLAGYFDLILGGDSPFGIKPEPAGLRHIMASLETAPEHTALIGDGVQDAGAARNAGAALIGFLGGIAPMEAMLKQNPDAVFSRMDELPAAVAGLETRPQGLAGRLA